MREWGWLVAEERRLGLFVGGFCMCGTIENEKCIFCRLITLIDCYEYLMKVIGIYRFRVHLNRQTRKELPKEYGVLTFILRL